MIRWKHKYRLGRENRKTIITFLIHFAFASVLAGANNPANKRALFPPAILGWPSALPKNR